MGATAAGMDEAEQRIINIEDKLDTVWRGIWRRRRMLGSLHPADHLDSTHTCVNNPENNQNTGRMDSLEPSIDKSPTEEGRKGGEVVRTTRTGRRELGQTGSPPSKQSP